jgi:hypothetical protein
MLVATPITSTHPSTETISKRMRSDTQKDSKEKVVDGDGFAHTRGTGNENAPASPTTVFSYSLMQSLNPVAFVSLHSFVSPWKMSRPQTALEIM